MFVQNNEVSGRNLYGILRAGRSLGTESIILSTPYLTSGTENHHGTAVMLALIEYFKSEYRDCIPYCRLCSNVTCVSCVQQRTIGLKI